MEFKRCVIRGGLAWALEWMDDAKNEKKRGGLKNSSSEQLFQDNSILLSFPPLFCRILRSHISLFFSFSVLFFFFQIPEKFTCSSRLFLFLVFLLSNVSLFWTWGGLRSRNEARER